MLFKYPYDGPVASCTGPAAQIEYSPFITNVIFDLCSRLGARTIIRSCMCHHPLTGASA